MQDRSSSILTKVFVSATTAPTIFLHHPYIHIGSLPSLIPLAHNHYLAHARIPSVQSLSQELTGRAQSFSHLAVAALHAYILTPRSRSPLAMLPAQRNKVDISSLSEEEQKLFRLYGKLPKKDLLQNRLKERKYFDSGDYALSKAGKAPQQSVGTAIPNPEMIPHASTVTSPGANAVSPPGSLPGQQAGGLAGPVNVPGAERLASRPQVSAFPISGAGSSPGKESSSLGREEHVVNADDAMQD